MQYSSIFGLATLLTLAAASPMKRTSSAVVTFNGAAGATYSLTVPLDGSVIPTKNSLSISTISSTINVATQCTLQTVNQKPALVEGPSGTWAVGPPETINSISCTAAYTPPSPTVISIQFNGATPQDKYVEAVTLGGSPVQTRQGTSVSTIVTTFADFATKCTLTTNNKYALSKIADNTWALGPPQPVSAVVCSS